MNEKRSALVLGARGLVGGAFAEELERRGWRVCAPGRAMPRGSYTAANRAAACAWDLRRHYEALAVFGGEHDTWDAVVLAAARVGGIGANLAEGAAMLHDNLLIQTHVLTHAATRCRRLIFLGSSCLYPRYLYPRVPPHNDHAALWRECDLGVGVLEESNRPYAIAKLAGIELCRTLASPTFTPIVLMPPNLHGDVYRDNYDPARSHVLQALIARFYAAACVHVDGKQLPTTPLWGTGEPRREFMRVEELARIGVTMLEREEPPEHGIYNVGYGYDVTIRDLAARVARRVGYEGPITFDGDASRNGVPHKTVDPSRLQAEYAWAPTHPMLEGIDRTIDEYLAMQRRRHRVL